MAIAYVLLANSDNTLRTNYPNGDYSPSPGAPDAPTSVSWSNITSTSMQLNWSHTDPDIDFYEVQLRTGPTWESVTPNPTGENHVFLGLEVNTQYGGRVRASKNGEWSPWSVEVYQSTLDDTVLPGEFSDDFNYPDGDLSTQSGGVWRTIANVSEFSVVNSEVEGSDFVSEPHYTSSRTTKTDFAQDIEVTFKLGSTFDAQNLSDYIGVIVRCDFDAGGALTKGLTLALRPYDGAYMTSTWEGGSESFLVWPDSGPGVTYEPGDYVTFRTVGTAIDIELRKAADPFTVITIYSSPDEPRVTPSACSICLYERIAGGPKRMKIDHITVGAEGTTTPGAA